jgi:transposase
MPIDQRDPPADECPICGGKMKKTKEGLECENCGYVRENDKY